MPIKIIVGLLIAFYAIYIIYRQVKNVKKGNYCGNCGGCPASKSCAKLQKNAVRKSDFPGKYNFK